MKHYVDVQTQSIFGSVTAEVSLASTVVRSSLQTLRGYIFITLTLTDPYENIYHVARGSKTFLLVPPTESWCLKGLTLGKPCQRLAMLNIVSRATVSSCNVSAGVGRFPPAPETFTLHNTTSTLVIDITSRTTRISTRYSTPYNHPSRGRGNAVSSSRLVAPCPTIWPDDRTKLVV